MLVLYGLFTQKKRMLNQPKIYVRIRPTCQSGGHAQALDRVEKRLSRWTMTSLYVQDRHEEKAYSFPQRVFGPEATQIDVFDTFWSACLHNMLKDEHVCLFAYGQTGTGKTHSIFGPEQSLSSSGQDENRGIFPRLVEKVLRFMNMNSKERVCTLEAQAVEFYMFQCFDLLNKKAVIALDRDNEPVGAVSKDIRSMEDCMAFLECVRRGRTSQGTRMNEANDGHGGSSRSHCALILTLRQVDRISREYVRTKLKIVDLAGAERPVKNGCPRQSVFEAMMAHWYGKQTTNGTVASQAAVINYELAGLAKEVIAATDMYRRKKKYSAPTQMSTMAIQFLAGCFNGNYRLGMLVCLSQAPNCGWETWFSLQYGNDLSKLKAPCRRQSIIELDKALRRAEKQTKNAQSAMESTPESGTPASKYYPQKRNHFLSSQQNFRCLQALDTLL